MATHKRSIKEPKGSTRIGRQELRATVTVVKKGRSLHVGKSHHSVSRSKTFASGSAIVKGSFKKSRSKSIKVKKK